MDSTAARHIEKNALPIVAALLMVAAAAAACGEGTSSGANGGNGTNGDAVTAPTLVGTWRSSTTLGCFGTVTDEIVFSPKGTFSHLTAFSAINCVPYNGLIHTTGDYKVESNLRVIHFSKMDTEPKQQCFPNGKCQPIAAVTDETDNYSMPDSNTLVLPSGFGGTTTYKRVT